MMIYLCIRAILSKFRKITVYFSNFYKTLFTKQSFGSSSMWRILFFMICAFWSAFTNRLLEAYKSVSQYNLSGKYTKRTQQNFLYDVLIWKQIVWILNLVFIFLSFAWPWCWYWKYQGKYSKSEFTEHVHVHRWDLIISTAKRCS